MTITGNFQEREPLAALTACVVETLQRYGPLEEEPLTYLVARDHQHKFATLIRQDDILRVHEWDLEHVFVSRRQRLQAAMRGELDDLCIRLTTEAERQPMIPPSRDYVGGYVELWLRLQLLRANPALLHTPDALVDDLFRPQPGEVTS